MFMPEISYCKSHLLLAEYHAIFVLSRFQIYVISLAEPRLPLQLDDAVRPEAEGEEVKTLHIKYVLLYL